MPSPAFIAYSLFDDGHSDRSKKTQVVISITKKIYFKIKTVTRDKEGHYIIIKGSIQEEDLTIVNIYAPNLEAPQYIKQILIAIRGELTRKTIIMGDFNTSLSSKHR